MTASQTEPTDPYVLTADGISEPETDPRLRGGGLLDHLLMVSGIAIGILGVYTLLDVFGVTIA